MRPTPDELRHDLRLIAEMIEPGARVLDIGCGDGALLAYLARHKGVDGRGIELSQSGVNACVGHGLSVIQGDADRDLDAYPARRLRRRRAEPDLAGDAGAAAGARSAGADRPARDRLVPEFRFLADSPATLLLRGRMPMSDLLPHPWYETPNIHLCTIRDFVALCDELGVTIERSVTLDRHGRPYSLHPHGSLANLLAEQGVFRFVRRGRTR